MARVKKCANINAAMALALTLINAGLVSSLGDYYFDLNDDVLIKDILSGVYTGTPNGHNIQLLYPLGMLIALFYRVSSNINWYGLFLCGIQYCCIFVIFYIVIGRHEKMGKRIGALSILLFSLATVSSHLLFIQYTFCCGIISATAIFLIMSHDSGNNKSYFAVALVILAYCLRSEMLLLLLPMIAVGMLIKYFLTKQELKKCITVTFLTLSGIVLCYSINRIGYGSAEWKGFNRLFDARTELYDFQYIPEYESNIDFYRNIGLSESDYRLLVNYNYGIDEKITAETLEKVADYAATLRLNEDSTFERIRVAASKYFYRLLHFSKQRSYEYPDSDFPWNLMVILLYMEAIFISFLDRDREIKPSSIILLLGLLFSCRSVLWMFVIFRGRYPIRIIHPLYLVEAAILFSIIHIETKGKKILEIVWLLPIGIVLLLSIPNQNEIIQKEIKSRAIMQSHYVPLYDYFNEHPDNFYFIDVFSSVSSGDLKEKEEGPFSEKMFQDVDNSFGNYDIMGGWAAKSPIFQEKMEMAGLTSIEESLLLDNVYFVQVLSEGTEWINDYYREVGINVTVNRVDKVENIFGIYSISLDE